MEGTRLSQPSNIKIPDVCMCMCAGVNSSRLAVFVVAICCTACSVQTWQLWCFDLGQTLEAAAKFGYNFVRHCSCLGFFVSMLVVIAFVC